MLLLLSGLPMRVRPGSTVLSGQSWPIWTKLSPAPPPAWVVKGTSVLPARLLFLSQVLTGGGSCASQTGKPMKISG